MSLLSELIKKPGPTKRRLGRGRGSNWGGTAGKGHKGQKARAGVRLLPGFEGGQMPMIRRLPKFGFKNIPFKTRYNIVNLSQLEQLDGDVTVESLKKLGLVGSGLVKILGNGKLTKSLNVCAHKFSASAKASIEKAKGQVQVIEQRVYEGKKSKKSKKTKEN